VSDCFKWDWTEVGRRSYRVSKKVWGLMFFILIVVMIRWVYTFVKTRQKCSFSTYNSSFSVGYTLIKLSDKIPEGKHGVQEVMERAGGVAPRR
jgi:hypothetical protein